MEIYGISDVGKVRELNEDSIEFGEFPDGVVYAIVCDGMGGASHGEVASKNASERIKNNFLSVYRSGFSEQSIKNMMNVSLNLANNLLRDLSDSSEKYQGMGTTAVLAVVKDETAVIANVGDSRAYLVGSEARRITEDHSFVFNLVKKGEISIEEAKTHPKRNIITRAVGAEKTVEADFYFEDLKEGETLLLCSDGLSGYVTCEEMAEACKKPLKEAAKMLVKAANDAGGRDNISLILVRI